MFRLRIFPPLSAGTSGLGNASRIFKGTLRRLGTSPHKVQTLLGLRGSRVEIVLQEHAAPKSEIHEAPATFGCPHEAAAMQPESCCD